MMIYEVYERLPVQSACLLIDINLVLAAQMVLDGGERRPQPLLLCDDSVDHHFLHRDSSLIRDSLLGLLLDVRGLHLRSFNIGGQDSYCFLTSLNLLLWLHSAGVRCGFTARFVTTDK